MTVKKKTKAKKAAPKTAPKKTASSTSVVDVAKVQTMPRGRTVQKYVDLVRQIEKLEEGKGLIHKVDRDPVAFCGSLRVSLRNTIEKLGLKFDVGIQTLSDRSGFLITRRKQG